MDYNLNNFIQSETTQDDVNVNEGEPWNSLDDQGIQIGPRRAPNRTDQQTTNTPYSLSKNYYTYRDNLSQANSPACHRKESNVTAAQMTVTMEKENFTRDFARRRMSPSAQQGVLNNGFVRQESETSLDVNLDNRRGSQTIQPEQKATNNKGNSLARRMSTLATVHVSQNFTEQAKRAVSKFSSVNYAPTHSLKYIEWLSKIKYNYDMFEWDRWFLTLVIGVVTGLVGWFLNQCLGGLGKVKWRDTQKYMEADRLLASWGWTMGISVVFVLISSILVAFVHPPAAGGGTPEVVAYLNGVVVHGVFGVKHLVIKFTANVFAVSSGLPAAIQGPIINYGAIIGKGFGQFRSETFGCTPKSFKRFRNAVDRRAFTTAGVAAGVAAAFNAPLGGLLFAMEDLSSFWSKRLSWQVFFCSVVATGIAGMFNAAFNSFNFGGVFGLFSLSVTQPIQIHIAVVCVSLVMGVFGGIMGGVFTLLNTRVVGVARKLALSKMSQPWGFKCGRVFETVLLAMIMSVYYTILPTAFDCTNVVDIQPNITSGVAECEAENGNTTYPFNLNPYACTQQTTSDDDFFFNEMATIIQNGGRAQLDILWSRGTHYYLKWYSMLVLLAVWFPMTAWTLGSCIAGGIFVPMMISGALTGRSFGLGMMALYRYITGDAIPTDNTWTWLDPGLIAVIGSGAILGGTMRLVLATTVIVAEMSQDINLIIPLLIAVFVAKQIADLISRPLVRCQLDAKTLPYLDHEPRVALHGEIANLEVYKASDIMSSPVRVIRAVESLYSLSQLLTSTEHEGFPVIRRDVEIDRDVCYGLITRNELYAILYCDELFNAKTDGSKRVIVDDMKVDYDELSQDYTVDTTAKYERVRSFGKFDMYKMIYVNLDKFINISVAKVDGDHSLHRTYQLFRTLGLRHLVVVDIKNQPIGMITRQDLMAFNIQDKLESLPVNRKLDDLMDESMSSDDTSQTDIVLPAITVVPSISSKIAETIHEESEEDSDDDKMTSSTPRPHKRHGSNRSNNSVQSTTSTTSHHSSTSKKSEQTQASTLTTETFNHSGWDNHKVTSSVDTTEL